MNPTPLNPDALKFAVRAFEKNANAYMQALYTSDEVIEDAITAYLAAAQPEVTSVEEVPAKLQIISWEEEPEHECWKLAPDETFVGLIVKAGRSWTPRDKYTLNIERPEVNDAS